MDIKHLPTGGFHFRLNKGRGNFAYKLYKVTKHGELKNLADNRESIVEALKPYQPTLKRYGGLNRLQQKKVYKNIKKQEGDLSWGDRHDIKKVIKYLDRNKAGEPASKNPFSVEPQAAEEAAAALPKVRINKDVSNVPSRVNPYIKRYSSPSGERHMGVVSANKSASSSAIRRQEGGFKVPPPPGATPPKPLSREASSSSSGRLRRVT
jgi:hypothetical protein